MDNNSQGIEKNQIGQDIEKLKKEITESKLIPEIKNYSEKDLIKQNIGQKLYPQGKSEAPIQKVQTAPAEDDKYLPDYLKNSERAIKDQVEKLLEITIRTGLEKGINEARKMPPFIMDAYHDALVDKLHEELIKRKMIN
jgi:hypothetical protein